MKHDPSLLLRALAAMLGYPDAALREALPEIVAVFRGARGLPSAARDGLVALCIQLRRQDPFEAEAAYVDLFDRGRRTSLNLFEHVHGDGRDRGPAMLDLRQRYLDAGLEPLGDELPDHLPVLLEYLSLRDADEVEETLGDCAHILRALGHRLAGRGSRYAAVFVALLAVAGAEGLDPKAPMPPPEDLDEAWEERPAFGGDPARAHDMGRPQGGERRLS